MTDRANYDLEEYAKALETESNRTESEYLPEGIYTLEQFAEHRQGVEYLRGYRQAQRSAVNMLRGTPMSLWTVWPMYFPDPEGKLISNTASDGETSYYKCPNGHTLNWNIGDSLKCSECDSDLVVVTARD